MNFDWKKHKAKTDKLIRKSLDRNQSIPIRPDTYKISNEEEVVISDTDSDCFIVEVPQVKKKKNKKKTKAKKPTVVSQNEDHFRRPQLHTLAKAMDKHFDAVSGKTVPDLLKVSDLTPHSKQFVRGQLTKQLNFKPDEKIYTHLLTLNDSISCLLPTQQAAIRSKRYEKLAKDPEPELSDVLLPEELNGLSISGAALDDFPDFIYPHILKPSKSNLNSLKMIVHHMQTCDPEFLTRRNVVTAVNCHDEIKEDDQSESSES